MYVDKSVIAKCIKKVRLDQGLTQTEFGSMIGVKGNTITGYENGVRVPSDSVINNICKTFGVNEGWLRHGGSDSEMYLSLASGESPLEKLFSDKNCNKFEIAFLSGYFQLNAQERTEFCKLVIKMFPDVISKIVDGDPLETVWQEAAPVCAPDATGTLGGKTKEELCSMVGDHFDTEKGAEAKSEVS